MIITHASHEKIKKVSSQVRWSSTYEHSEEEPDVLEVLEMMRLEAEAAWL